MPHPSARRRSALAVASCGLALAVLPAAPASAQGPAFGACPKGVPAPKAARCAALSVPLDHSGQVPGRVTLALSRVRATRTKLGTLVFLAGGPGQAALPLTRGVVRRLGPVRRNYDIVVLDQRGTGRSSAVRCSTTGSALRVARRCGRKLGARRAFWTTRETALDLEDLRVALGEPKLSLFAVSYGAKVAGEYARRFPATTGALVLDSPVPVDGLDVFQTLRQLGLPRVLDEVCHPPGCGNFVADARRAVQVLARRLERRPLRGYLVEPDGRRTPAPLRADDLYLLIALSDLDPLLRAELPAAIASGVLRDPQPLLRLLTLAAAGPAGQEASTTNTARFLATSCVEGRLPWEPESDPAARLTALADYVRNTPRTAFDPFPRTLIVRNSIAAQCVAWPQTPEPDGVASPGPDVPVLVIGGREDLRTPLEDARRTAGQYPNGIVLPVPGVGHSVLASDPSPCTATRITAFLQGRAVRPCSRRVSRSIVRAPFIPARLSDLQPQLGVPTRVGRVITAIKATSVEVVRSALALPGVLAGSQVRGRVPGLRRGFARFAGEQVTLSDYEVVRGVRLSGTAPGTLTVRAPGGITGTLRAREDGRLEGVLGGSRVVIRLPG